MRLTVRNPLLARAMLASRGGGPCCMPGTLSIKGVDGIIPLLRRERLSPDARRYATRDDMIAGFAKQLKVIEVGCMARSSFQRSLDIPLVSK